MSHITRFYLNYLAGKKNVEGNGGRMWRLTQDRCVGWVSAAALEARAAAPSSVALVWRSLRRLIWICRLFSSLWICHLFSLDIPLFLPLVISFFSFFIFYWIYHFYFFGYPISTEYTSYVFISLDMPLFLILRLLYLNAYCPEDQVIRSEHILFK